jgi:serine/threonine protein kinase
MRNNDSIPKTVNLSDSEVAWNALTDIIDSFAVAWDQSPPEPNLDEFTPPLQQPYRRLALTELIKVDLEYRAELGQVIVPLEDYARRWPELHDEGGIPTDLIYEDYRIRSRHDHAAELGDYTRRFPHAATALRRMLADENSGATTSIIAARHVAGFEPGQRVDDFDLLVQLGKGAFATVFLARQNSMQRLVALKISADQGVEPQTLAQLDHPHIVRVYDQRQLPDRDVRLMYMQYVAGGTLQDALQHLKSMPPATWKGNTFVTAIDQCLIDRGEEPAYDSQHHEEMTTLSWPQVVCRLGEQLAGALDYAHKQNVLHRDIKPANVLLTAEGHAKLVDFNVSFCGEVAGASPATFFGGSLVYMSPEQLQACNPHHERTPAELDGRSDVYSLGVLLHELLSGERPFGEERVTGNWSETLSSMIKRRQEWLDTSKQRLNLTGMARENCPRLLLDAIDRCLQPKVEKRFSSAAELRRQLNWAAQPGTRQVLEPPELLSRPLAARFALVIMLGLMLLPNVMSAWFIYSYNLIEAVPTRVHGVFWKTQGVINGIAFPLGILLLILVALPVTRVIRRIRAERDVTADSIYKACKRNLMLGQWCAIVCMPLWAFAGVLYPAILSQQNASLDRRAWFDFMGSHALAGVIASAYAFFAVTYFCLRVWQPQLMKAMLFTTARHSLKPSLDLLGWLLSFYQLLSAIIPLVSLTLLVTWGEAKNRFALSVLCLASLLGSVVLFWISKRLQSIVTTLQQLVD